MNGKILMGLGLTVIVWVAAFNDQFALAAVPAAVGIGLMLYGVETSKGVE